MNKLRAEQLNSVPKTRNVALQTSQAQTLINGISSGDVTQTTAVLWTRSTSTGDVTFEVAEDDNFSNIVQTLSGTVTASNVPVKVNVADLRPGTEYFYRIQDGAGDQKTGTFHTAFASGIKAGLRFGASGNWRGDLAPYASIQNASTRDLDFFVKLGNTIYADFESPAVLNPDGTRVSQAETLSEFRAKQEEVLSDRFGLNILPDLHASTSILATIDDHEVTNNFAGGALISTDSRFSGLSDALINDSDQYENGLQAFQDYQPLRDEFYGETGDDRFSGERKLYRFNTYGDDAAVFVLDNWSFRDELLQGVADLTNQADVGRFLFESFTGDRTSLGSVQLETLKQDLLAADAAGTTWKFIMLPEPVQDLGLFIPDNFEGYAQERNEILQFIDVNNIDNVVFVADYLHATFVNNLTYQETLGGPRIPTNAFEITTGAVAYDPPFGIEITTAAAALGLISAEEFAFYDSLPIAPDTDDISNDRDDFFKTVLNTATLAPLGFDPLGLDDNLQAAEGLIDATLIQGDYVVAHTYGWTEFDIDPTTQQLRVTTYGIDAYTEAELLADPTSITSQTPRIVSEFVVSPAGTQILLGGDGNDNFFGDKNAETLFGSDTDNIIKGAGGADSINGLVGDDILHGNQGDDTLLGSDGNDRLVGNRGDDILDGGAGNDIYRGGAGADIFVLRQGEGVDVIRKFSARNSDIIQLSGGLTVDDLTITPFRRRGATLSVNGEDIAIIRKGGFENITPDIFAEVE